MERMTLLFVRQLSIMTPVCQFHSDKVCAWSCARHSKISPSGLKSSTETPTLLGVRWMRESSRGRSW